MAPGVHTRQPEAITAHPANLRMVPQRQPEAITAVPTTQMLLRVGLEKDRLGPMTWPKGEGQCGLAYTGRRVSSLVPWGGSEEPETVKVSQDVVNRQGEGDWEGEGVGEGAGGEGEGVEEEGEGGNGEEGRRWR
jgi:hypothetical protein